MEGKLMLGILIVACLCWNSMARPSPPNEFQSLLKNVADDPKLNASHISGPNGYCMDASSYKERYPIVLWPCKSDSVNQIWTFESDKTLRSNGKCLITSKFHQGSDIMIHDCSTAHVHAIQWELKSDGKIVNRRTRMALTAMPGTVGTALTLEESNVSSSFQTWCVGNDTEPSLVSIIGMNNLCLQATESAVWVGECESGNVQQQWLLYPDGTIRPKERPKWCLSYVSLTDRRVLALSCGLGPSSQRWLFATDGTILNERVNLVMDVRLSDPSLKQIIVQKATGLSNQKWKVEPLSYSNIREGK